MTTKLFTTSTLENAIIQLTRMGAHGPSIAEKIEQATKTTGKKFDIIIGKFSPSRKCKDGFCIRITPKELYPMLKADNPSVPTEGLKYMVIAVKNAKNDTEMVRGMGLLK